MAHLIFLLMSRYMVGLEKAGREEAKETLTSREKRFIKFASVEFKVGIRSHINL